MASSTKGGGGSKPTQSQSQAKAQVAADERRQTIVAAQVAAQRYVGQSGRDQRVTNPSRGEQAASARLTQQAAQQAAQQAKKQIIATEAKKDAARASQYAGITRNPSGGTRNTGSGTKKPGKPFIFGPGDPAPTIPGLPNRGAGGGGGGGGGGGNDPDPGPTIYTEFRGASSSPSSSAPPSPVLIPGRDALNFATSGVVNALTSFIFEDLAGTEIITLMKRDTIDGIDPNYSIISNISDARRTFDPTSLLSKKSKTDSYFDIFGIQLLDKIPDDEYLAKNSIVNYYYIASNGDLVIELDNLSPDERVEIEIATNGTINELDNS